MICSLYCGSMHELTLQTCQQLWIIQKCNHLFRLYSQSTLLCLQLNQLRGNSWRLIHSCVSHLMLSNSLHTQSWICAFKRQMSFRHIHLLIHFEEPIEALYMILTWASAMFLGCKSWGHSQGVWYKYKQKTTLHKVDSHHASQPFPPFLTTFVKTLALCLLWRCEDFGKKLSKVTNSWFRLCKNYMPWNSPMKFMDFYIVILWNRCSR